MDLTQLIQHPQNLNKQTLYDLRSLLATYPYYQTARLLMLKNLYLLHDPCFDEELRRAALYITDRKALFQLVEAAHYQIKQQQQKATAAVNKDGGSRTVALIDSFLDTIPPDDKPDNAAPRRRPTPADATIDYVSYLLETENDEPETTRTPQMKGQSLIDNFINNEQGAFQLKEQPEYLPDLDNQNTDDEHQPEYFTETLARIYIKQGRYSKALEIIKRLNLLYPKKNRYFADQIRFLEKLLLNESYNPQTDEAE